MAERFKVGDNVAIIDDLTGEVETGVIKNIIDGRFGMRLYGVSLDHDPDAKIKAIYGIYPARDLMKREADG